MNKIDKVVLDNGLTIYFYVDKKRHSVFFQHITKYGGISKDFICDGKEYHLQDGIAHILEHYIVEENKYGNFLKLLGEKQMSTNASTHLDMTRFYFNAIENVEFGVKTLLKGIYSPLFSEERLEKMKGPIFQELRGRSDSKFYHAANSIYKNLFNNSTFMNIGGSLEDVKNTTLDELKLCYEAFYQPSNQLIVVGGNFDKDEMLNLIKDFYDSIDIPKHDVKLIEMNEDDKVRNSYEEILFPTGQEYVEIAYKFNLSKYSPEQQLKTDFYLAYFYKMFFGLTSPLYNKLVNNKIITGGIGSNLAKFRNYMILSFGSHSDDPDTFIEEIKNTIMEMKDFNEELFELDKRQTILDLILREENISNMVMPFVANIVSYNYCYPDSVEQVEKYNYDDFVKTIKELDFSNYTVIKIKNKE